MPNSTDVAIIGGGIIGCSIAYYLAKRGIGSTVFERESFACGASGATAGMFSPLWHVDHANEPLFNMGMSSLDTIPHLTAELADAGVDPLFRQCGILKVAMSSEEASELRHDLIWQGELGIGVRWMDADEVAERVPEINTAVQGGVFSPTEGHVTGQRMVESLVHAATRLGATFLEGVEVTDLMTEGDRRVTGVRTAHGDYPAGQTVIAAGPWAGLLSEQIPIRAVKGQRMLLRLQGFLPEFIVHRLEQDQALRVAPLLLQLAREAGAREGCTRLDFERPSQPMFRFTGYQSSELGVVGGELRVHFGAPA